MMNYINYISVTGLSYKNPHSVNIYSTSNYELVNYLDNLEKYDENDVKVSDDNLDTDTRYSMRLYAEEGAVIELENIDIDMESILSASTSNKELWSLNINSTTKIPDNILKKRVNVDLNVTDGWVKIVIKGNIEEAPEQTKDSRYAYEISILHSSLTNLRSVK